MATELTARLYFDAEPAPPEVFARLVDAVTAWGEANASWQGLRVSGPKRQVIHRDDTPLASGALNAAAARFGDSAQQLASRISYRCSRFHDRTAELGSSLRTAAQGYDAGLDQQAFQMLEAAPDDIDWSVIESLEARAAE